MVDNNSIFTVTNNLLCKASNVTVISNGTEIINAIQPEILNSAIIVTPEQLASLGIKLDNNNVTNNSTNIDVNNSNVKIRNNSLKHRFNNGSYNEAPKDFHNNETQLEDNISNNKQTIKQPNADVRKKSNSNKIVYHILHPEELRLTEKKSQLNSNSVQKIDEKNNSIKPVALKPVSVLPTIKPKLNKSKQKESKELFKNEKDTSKPKEFKIDIKKNEEKIVTKSVTTRSGRVTKPPKHLKQVKNERIINKNDEFSEPPKKQFCASIPVEDMFLTSSVKTTQDIQPVDNIEMKISNDLSTLSTFKEKGTEIIEKKKKLSTKYQCKTCKRYYLGRVRMKKHLNLNPDHKVPVKYEPNDETWINLLERINKVPKHKQVAKLFGELAYLLQKAKDIIPSGLKPALNSFEPNSYNIDNMLSILLGVPEGNYIFDVNTLNEDNNISGLNENQERNSFESEHSAQTSLLNLLDTGQVTFDTSDSVNSSEAVMCVDQLVNERLKTLTGVELSAPSDNQPSSQPTDSSQNLSLDLSLDMFSYTN